MDHWETQANMRKGNLQGIFIPKYPLLRVCCSYIKWNPVFELWVKLLFCLATLNVENVSISTCGHCKYCVKLCSWYDLSLPLCVWASMIKYIGHIYEIYIIWFWRHGCLWSWYQDIWYLTLCHSPFLYYGTEGVIVGPWTFLWSYYSHIWKLWVLKLVFPMRLHL